MEKKPISGIVTVVIVIVALLLIVSWGVRIYNKIVPMNEKVATAMEQCRDPVSAQG